ncbi:MAG: hypothetical protein GXP27_18315 [Planctomycetes bacterium]|nr:hypothetical protein [Planctomycetota bacterium]
MTGSANGSELRLGFLTAIELPDKGFVAGLLVTNRFSRPLEFQCTTPVKPNRTQELLYGPTLRPFLLGELLSRPLIEKVGIKPDLIVTDRPEMLNLRQHVRVPVVHVEAEPAAHAITRTDATANGDRTSAVPVPDDTGATEGGADSTGSQRLVPADSISATRNPESSTFSIGSCRLRVDPAHHEDHETLEQFRPNLPRQLDLREPIQRVQEALREATAAMGGSGR